MKKEEDEKIIPPQHVGKQMDATHEYDARTEEEAKEVFNMAVKRLLNVNVWDKICGPLSAKFMLTDDKGKDAFRSPQPGDYFKIDIPGPGPSAGDGYDWVHVEALEDMRRALPEESLTIRVRPSPSPQNSSPDTAHFFSESATSSFRVRRIGTKVLAEVHGRNEVANTSVDKPTDKIRNTMVGGGAKAGLSNPQWKSLVKGLLDSSIDVA